MTLDELIEKLQRVREFHGGTAPVIVTGAYASWADDLEVNYHANPKSWFQPSPCVEIGSSICSG